MIDPVKQKAKGVWSKTGPGGVAKYGAYSEVLKKKLIPILLFLSPKLNSLYESNSLGKVQCPFVQAATGNDTMNFLRFQ